MGSIRRRHTMPTLGSVRRTDAACRGASAEFGEAPMGPVSIEPLPGLPRLDARERDVLRNFCRRMARAERAARRQPRTALGLGWLGPVSAYMVG